MQEKLEKTDITTESHNKKASTSGFTDDLGKEMTAADPMPVESAFGNLAECYVSASGHTRLFSATRYGKRYILKCLKKDFLYTPIYQQALTKEFEIGLQLEHPYICRTIGLEQLPDLGPTIVMEYIDGENLQCIIDKKTLTTDQARKITLQLMDALEYMHNKQIIHRDLKPSNIMITHTGQNVKVIDFGLSDSDTFFVLKLPAGTSGYIAPEQLMLGARSEPRADIYSLGMVIADMTKVVEDKALEKMAMLCTTRDIYHRPESIEELRKHSFDTPRHPRIVALLSILLIVFAAIIIGTYYYRAHLSKTLQETVEGDSTSHSDNQVLDYQLWDK